LDRAVFRAGTGCTPPETGGQGRVAATVRILIDRSLLSEAPHNRARINNRQKFCVDRLPAIRAECRHAQKCQKAYQRKRCGRAPSRTIGEISEERSSTFARLEK